MPDVKSILDAIIDGANNKFPNTVNSTMHQNMGVKEPQTFDAGKFREKLSLYVLKDIICAMMHDETKDLDGMIDQSIMRHIHDDYGCTCYDYLCKSRDKLNSPILSDVIQEIDEKTMSIQSKVVDKQDDSGVTNEDNLKEELHNVDNYDQLRQQLKEIVSKKVVDDVSKVITQSNDAPVFDDLDKKIVEKKTTKEELPLESEDTTNESTIIKMTGMIVAEGAGYGYTIASEDAMNAAIIEYCICEMDYLFKMDPSMAIRRGWDGNKTIQESFFDVFEDGKYDGEVSSVWTEGFDETEAEFRKNFNDTAAKIDATRKQMEEESKAWHENQAKEDKAVKIGLIAMAFVSVATLATAIPIAIKEAHERRNPYGTVCKLLDKIASAGKARSPKEVLKYLKKLSKKCTMLDNGYNWSNMPDTMLSAMRELKVAADVWIARGPNDTEAEENFTKKAKAFIDCGLSKQELSKLKKK